MTARAPGPDGPADDRHRLAQALRRLTELGVGRPLDDATLAAAADAAERLADRLTAAAGPGRRELGEPGRRPGSASSRPSARSSAPPTPSPRRPRCGR